jgi:hypothetical protein
MRENRSPATGSSLTSMNAVTQKPKSGYSTQRESQCWRRLRLEYYPERKNVNASNRCFLTEIPPTVLPDPPVDSLELMEAVSALCVLYRVISSLSHPDPGVSAWTYIKRLDGDPDRIDADQRRSVPYKYWALAIASLPQNRTLARSSSTSI